MLCFIRDGANFVRIFCCIGRGICRLFLDYSDTASHFSLVSCRLEWFTRVSVQEIVRVTSCVLLLFFFLFYILENTIFFFQGYFQIMTLNSFRLIWFGKLYYARLLCCVKFVEIFFIIFCYLFGDRSKEEAFCAEFGEPVFGDDTYSGGGITEGYYTDIFRYDAIGILLESRW